MKIGDKDYTKEEIRNIEKFQKDISDTQNLYEFVEKIAKANVLLYAVMESDEMDIYDEPCKVNIEKYNGFYKAVEILSELKAKGKCNFEASDIRKEYIIHTIYIKWNLTDDFWMCIDDSNKTEIKTILDCMDECLIRDDEANIWQLSSKIYVPIREIEGE